MCVATPNDPRSATAEHGALPARRGKGGGKEAGSVTCGAVSCIAWLGDVPWQDWGIALKIDNDLPCGDEWWAFAMTAFRKLKLPGKNFAPFESGFAAGMAFCIRCAVRAQESAGQKKRHQDASGNHSIRRQPAQSAPAPLPVQHPALDSNAKPRRPSQMKKRPDHDTGKAVRSGSSPQAPDRDRKSISSVK